MNNYRDLEEENKEVENSKSILHDSENEGEIKGTADESDKQKGEEKKEGGSGIFTADGKELPNIEGGYDVIDPGGSLGDDDFVSI